MDSRVAGAASLLAVVLVPFVLRPRDGLLDETGEQVVIVTPHNEAIRFELGRAFHEHMRRARKRNVSVDWRTVGGTNEIARFIHSSFAGAFELYWKRDLGRAWTPAVAGAFANPAVVPSPGPAESLESLARRTFLESNVGIGVDLLFGGGSFEYMNNAAAGRIVDAGVVSAHPELFNERVIPSSSGGEPYWDPHGRWFGACLSAFGICYNKDDEPVIAAGQASAETSPASW
ncbi:MAG TPA: hypothetical protein VJT73_00760, partial [Polyangiaceae bacterium]|nr:hypothetical protein [Polyangiaceae bacterium]